jgi:Fe-S cluster assembly iron-binding protein IscA
MANLTYYTYGTMTAPNFNNAVAWTSSGPATQQCTMTIAGLTSGTLYRTTLTPTVNTGAAPVITLSGATLYSPITTLTTATAAKIDYIPTGTSVVFTFTNTAAGNWTTGSTSTYALTPVIVPYDSLQSASPYGSFWAYSANPTAGTGVTIRNKMLNFGLAGAAGVVIFDFMTQNDKPLLLHNVVSGSGLSANCTASGVPYSWCTGSGTGAATESLAVYLNGEAVATGSQVSVDCEWEESAP